LARIDDYRESFRLAALELKTVNLHRCAKRAGAEIDVRDDGVVELRLPFLQDHFRVLVKEELEVLKENHVGEVPLPEKILITHYLLHASGEMPTGNCVTFRNIPDGQFYFDAFQRRARDPFLRTFGEDPGLFQRAGEHLGGQAVAAGDVSMTFQVLPRIAVQLTLWRGDEEFSAEAGILFDENIQTYLPAEDIAVLTGMLVYRLMGIARGLQSATAR
jgi:hypothetical protein